MRKGDFQAVIIDTESGLIKFAAAPHHADCMYDGYVSLKHGTQYAIKLTSFGSRGNATIVIDGKEVGCFRVSDNHPSIIERPVNIDKKFTFYKLDSIEADKAGLNPKNEYLGMVQIIFLPEKQQEVYSPRDGEKSVTFGTTRGGTGLSGASNQKFTNTSRMEVDYSKEIIITFKLQCASDDIVPLTSINVSNTLTRQEFCELYAKDQDVTLSIAKDQLVKLSQKGVIDPDNLNRDTIAKIREYYSNGWF